MQRTLGRAPDLDWQREALRRSAVAASLDSRRSLWVAGLATAATFLFGLSLLFVPGGLALITPGFDALRPFVEQTRGLPVGDVSSERLQTLSHPLWLVLGRFTGDLAFAALILSGLSAIVSLFLVYQLCHGISQPEHADEQAAYALLGLALTPTFFLAAAGGGTEIPYLALVLAALVCGQRALVAGSPLAPMAFVGLFFGLSLLIRPLSLVVPPAVLTWLLVARPFGKDDFLEALKPALGFAAAFVVGAAPTLLLHLTYGTSPVAWGPAELGMLGGRMLADPLRFLLALGETILHYLAADDLERVGGIGGSWAAGDWLALPGAIIALAPTILKLLGVAGLACLLWLERFESAADRLRLPLILLVFAVLGGALGLVEERSLLLLGALLVVFAFAGLPSLLPGPLGGIAGLTLIGFLIFHQFGAGHAARQSPAFRASDNVAAALRSAGATPNQVMSANWRYYDTRSPWKGRYLHIPVYVNSTEALIQETKRQGARYLVFDRQVGAGHWPRLAGLTEAERPPRGLRALGTPLTTAESPPNLVAIYTLE